MFSGIVGMFGVKALDAISPYKKHKHPDTAQQRFPDLSLGGRLSAARIGGEIQGEHESVAIQSHHDHPGAGTSMATLLTAQKLSSRADPVVVCVWTCILLSPIGSTKEAPQDQKEADERTPSASNYPRQNLNVRLHLAGHRFKRQQTNPLNCGIMFTERPTLSLRYLPFPHQNPNSTTKAIAAHLGVSNAVAKMRLDEYLFEGKVCVKGAKSRAKVWELSPELFANYDQRYKRLFRSS